MSGCVGEEELEDEKMKSFCAILPTSMCLLALTPARAEERYPAVPCRVFVDTDWIQIPNQCGTGVALVSAQIIPAADEAVVLFLQSVMIDRCADPRSASHRACRLFVVRPLCVGNYLPWFRCLRGGLRRARGRRVSYTLPPVLERIALMNDRSGDRRSEFAGLRNDPRRRCKQGDHENGRDLEMISHIGEPF